MNLKQIIKIFLEQKTQASLSEIYAGVQESNYLTHAKDINSCVRRTLYSNPDTFTKVAKGVYMLAGKHSSSLLINGDGRMMPEIEDGTIDCIITDHPWEDTKANKGGNRDFANYSAFRYTKSDFEEKARVLKEGAYLAEILPIESSTNWDYLYQIKCLAKECGLQYYTHCIWKGAPQNSVNTGKVTKGVQQVVIFSKGKPRKLSREGVNAYQTKEMLKYELEYYIPRQAKDRNHQAEKPIELYEYLINNLTEEHDICLDQFGGSCNMLAAATNTNRFGIIYELTEDFCKKAVNRFNLTIYHAEESPSKISFMTDADGQVKMAFAS